MTKESTVASHNFWTNPNCNPEVIEKMVLDEMKKSNREAELSLEAKAIIKVIAFLICPQNGGT